MLSGYIHEPGLSEIRQENCQAHGQFESRRLFQSIWSRCPQCNIEEERAKIIASEARAREERSRNWRRKVEDSGIPERFRTRTLDVFQVGTEKQALAMEFARDYADNFDDVLKSGRSALFIGPPGTGKTHLAAGIALQIMHQQNRTVLFTTVIRALRKIKNTWRRNSEETEGEVVANLVSPDLLILDEVGVQFGSDTELALLFDVINERYEKCRPTLLISNLSREEVKRYLGERSYDRLREGNGQVVVFEGASYRGSAVVGSE